MVSSRKEFKEISKNANVLLPLRDELKPLQALEAILDGNDQQGNMCDEEHEAQRIWVSCGHIRKSTVSRLFLS